jgi:hypothetical protein
MLHRGSRHRDEPGIDGEATDERGGRMVKIREYLAHPIIQIALAAGASIIVLAYVSKRVLPEPLSTLELALPPFVATLFEAVAETRKGAWYTRPIFGIITVALATVLVVAFNA